MTDDAMPMESNGGPGRRTNGTFAPGHKFARGNPRAKHQKRLHDELHAAVNKKVMRALWIKMVKFAAEGDTSAMKLICVYRYGKPEAFDTMARLEELQELVREMRLNARAN